MEETVRYRVEPLNPSRRPATARQRQIYDAVLDHIDRTGKTPTLRELAAVFDCSRTAIKDHLDELQSRGWIDWAHGQHRTIQPRGVRS